MRPVLQVILAIVLLSHCFADADVAPRAIVAGEIDHPGRFELARAATLNAIFSEIAKPLAMGATNRIRVYRNGVRRDYDLNKFGDVAVVDGDIVEVPVKHVQEGQAEDSTEPWFCEDPKALLRQIGRLKSDLWNARTNWHEGMEGIEFRPTGEVGASGGVSVFVRTATPDELTKFQDQNGHTEPNKSSAVLVICRDLRQRANPSEFEATLIAQIRAIHCQETKHRKQSSEQTVPSNTP